MKKIIFIIFVFLIACKVSASSLSLIPSKNEVGMKEQFYVDVILDPESVSVNGIEGSVIFPKDKVTFVRAEDGKSMVDFWVEKPVSSGDKVNFTGIISGGFDGVIDPFNPNKKLPGMIIRLVFEAEKSGEINFNTNPVDITLNDGLGTIENILPVSILVNVSNIENKFIINNNNDAPPILNAYVTRDPNLYDNKYVLVFQASDKNTGVESVLVREGDKNWKKVESPYLLEDQGRHSIIVVQATNYSGISTNVLIDPIPYNLFSIISIVIVILFVLLLLFFIIKKKYAKKK
jgi:hypothetical protein